ncbi:MAG: YbaK/EbsC family protein [Isosphaeraceae bacterium]
MAISGWFKGMLEQRRVVYQELRDRVAFRVQEAARHRLVGAEVLAKLVVVSADDRIAVLILSSSRRVVLERVRRLLGADVVCLIPESELEGIFADLRLTGTDTDLAQKHESIALLMDASLLSEGDLVLQAGSLDDSIPLTFEDWLTLAKPGLGFFTEPDHGASQAVS